MKYKNIQCLIDAMRDEETSANKVKRLLRYFSDNVKFDYDMYARSQLKAMEDDALKSSDATVISIIEDKLGFKFSLRIRTKLTELMGTDFESEQVDCDQEALASGRFALNKTRIHIQNANFLQSYDHLFNTEILVRSKHGLIQNGKCSVFTGFANNVLKASGVDSHRLSVLARTNTAEHMKHACNYVNVDGDMLFCDFTPATIDEVNRPEDFVMARANDFDKLWNGIRIVRLDYQPCNITKKNIGDCITYINPEPIR